MVKNMRSGFLRVKEMTEARERYIEVMNRCNDSELKNKVTLFIMELEQQNKELVELLQEIKYFVENNKFNVQTHEIPKRGPDFWVDNIVVSYDNIIELLQHLTSEGGRG